MEKTFKGHFKRGKKSSIEFIAAMVVTTKDGSYATKNIVPVEEILPYGSGERLRDGQLQCADRETQAYIDSLC